MTDTPTGKSSMGLCSPNRNCNHVAYTTTFQCKFPSLLPAGADYQEMINSELVFSGEATSQVVRLQTTEDQVFEERETFLVLLSLLSCPGVGEVDGQRDVVTIVIDDDDDDDIGE